ncbi:membrane protein [Cupriavidus sp. HPC(L)]|uniref:TerC family protein n=1 Tax=Cupriavidus TaxID=106589 RepID=UPI0003BF9419|nr:MULTISPECIES: TerC family protein [Cupriavidus]ESJ25953.1 membrane protein [Cupriavidus sp. HPC(L)]
MEWLTDPTIWIGLATLIVLEIVLGIDNLVFIAILADKLPPEQRDKARIIGLSLALFMRLGLLSVMSWLVTLTRPLFALGPLEFSGRDLILLAGGIFLLVKATLELHERIEGKPEHEVEKPAYAGFWLVVTQIVILDAVFSLDSVITAVGMVDHLSVMMVAVVVAIAVMLFASKPLTRFVNAHPTVVVLCLSFLLMIGLSLVADGFGFHIPKGYLYAAIGFSVGIEALNQLARRNLLRYEARRPMRQRTADAVLRLLGARRAAQGQAGEPVRPDTAAPAAFAPEERTMVSGVLSLAERSVRSIMTPRSELSWIDIEQDADTLRRQILATPHSFFPVCRGQLDEILGVARGKDLIGTLAEQGRIDETSLRPPIVVPESIRILPLMETLRASRGQLVLVTDEYGAVLGVVTPVDVLEAIAGEFPDEDEHPTIAAAGQGRWLIDGSADLHAVAHVLELGEPWTQSQGRYASLGGLLLDRFGIVPPAGSAIDLDGYRFTVVEATERRIDRIEVVRLGAESVQAAADAGQRER